MPAYNSTTVSSYDFFLLFFFLCYEYHFFQQNDWLTYHININLNAFCILYAYIEAITIFFLLFVNYYTFIYKYGFTIIVFGKANWNELQILNYVKNNMTNKSNIHPNIIKIMFIRTFFPILLMMMIIIIQVCWILSFSLIISIINWILYKKSYWTLNVISKLS